MKIDKIILKNFGSGDSQHELAPCTFFTGTNMSGKSTRLRGTELGLRPYLRDPERPAEFIKTNPKLFRFATDGTDRMSSALIFDNNKTVERKFRRTGNRDGVPSVSNKVSFTGESAGSSERDKDSQLAQWLRADPAGLDIAYLPALTEMEQRKLLIDMLARIPSEENDEQQIKTLRIALSIVVKETQSNIKDAATLVLDIVEPLFEDLPMFGSKLDKLRTLEVRAKDSKKEIDAELKICEASQKKLGEDESLSHDPLDEEALKKELADLNETIPKLTKQQGSGEATITIKENLESQIKDLSEFKVACPGEWDNGFPTVITSHKGCKHCKEQRSAQLDYINGILGKLDEFKDKAIKDEYDRIDAEKSKLKTDFDTNSAELKATADPTDWEKQIKDSDERFAAEIKGIPEDVTTLQADLSKVQSGISELGKELIECQTFVSIQKDYLKTIGAKDDSDICPICKSGIDTKELSLQFQNDIDTTRERISEITDSLISFRQLKQTCENEIDALIGVQEKANNANIERVQAVKNRRQEIENNCNKAQTILDTLYENGVKKFDEDSGQIPEKARLDFVEYEIQLRNLTFDIKKYNSDQAKRLELEGKIQSLTIPNLDNLNTQITQKKARQELINGQIELASLAAKLTEKKTEVDEEAETLRLRLACIKEIVKAVGTKGLQGDIFKQQAGPFIDKVNEVLQTVWSDKKFGIEFLNPRGKEACEFYFEESGKSWDWSVASRGEKNIACIAIAIARMRLNEDYTIRVLMVDNLDMMDSIYEDNLTPTIDLCLTALKEGWIDNALLAGIIDKSKIVSHITDDEAFKLIELK